MSANRSTLDLVFNLTSAGDGGKVTREQIDDLKNASDELNESAKAAADQLSKGGGLASDPAEFLAAQAKQSELTAAEAEEVEKLTKRLEKLIAVKKALGQEYATEAQNLQRLNRAIEASPLAFEREAKAELSLVDAMAAAREKSQADAAQRRAAMESAQLDAIAKVAEQKWRAAGEQSGKSFSESLEHHLKRHFATLAGNLADVPGIGGMVASLGAAGAAAAVGIGAVEKAIDVVVAKYQEWRKESEAVAAAFKQIGNKDEVSALHRLAEAISSNEHSTAEWLKALTELRRFGASDTLIQPLSEHVRQLADRLGGDLKRATEIATQELVGNFAALRQLGVVVDQSASKTEQLAQAFEQLATSAPRNLSDIEDAANKAKNEVQGIREESEQAAKALDEAAAAAGRFEKALNASRKAKEDLDLAIIRSKVAEGKLSPEEGDAQIAAVKRQNMIAAHEASQAALREKLRGQQSGAGTERDALERQGADLNERRRIVSVLSEANGVTVDDLTKFSRLRELLSELRGGTISGAGNAELLGLESGDVGKRLRALFGADLRSDSASALFEKRANAFNQLPSLPPGRNNLPAEREALNKLEEGLPAAQKATAERLNKYAAKIAELEQQLSEAQAIFEANLQKFDVETASAAKVAANRKTEAAQKKYETYMEASRRAEELGRSGPELPPELRPYIQNGKLFPPKDFQPQAAPRVRTPFDPDATINQRPYEHWDTEPVPRGQQMREIQLEQRINELEKQLQRNQGPQERGLISYNEYESTMVSSSMAEVGALLRNNNTAVLDAIMQLKRQVSDLEVYTDRRLIDLLA